MPLKKPELQNSAGRLLALMTSINQNNSISDMAHTLYDIPNPSKKQKQQAAMRFLMDLHNLYVEFHNDLKVANITDMQRQAMLSGLANIEDTIYPNQTTNPFRGVTEAELSLLKVCATFIDQADPVSSDEIAAIRSSIAELRMLVESGDIPPILQKTLLELIRLSEDAISRFNIEGAQGLRRAFKNMLGEASDVIGRIDSEEERAKIQNSSAWAALVKHLKTCDSVLTRVLRYAPFLAGAAKILLRNPESPAE